MEQIIDFPTRGENILEIVATNRPNLIYRCLPYPGMSDHDTTILLDIDCHPKKTKQKSRLIHIWNRVDMNEMKKLVSAEVSSFINNNTNDIEINLLWKKFKQIEESAMQLVPKKYTSTRYSKPWITRECKRTCRRKKRAYNRAKRTHSLIDWANFRDLLKKSRKECRDAYNHHVRQCVSPDRKGNTKKLFSFIKSKKCENMGISPLRHNGKIYVDDRERANILNNQFASVFTESDDITPVLSSKPNPSMSDIHVSVVGVKKMLKKTECI